MADLPMQLDRRHNIDLERRSVEPHARRVVLSLLLAVVVAALVGVFGQSPASSSVVGAGRTRLSLSAPEGLRGGLIYQAKIEIQARRELRKAALVMDSGWFEGITLNSTVPEPLGWAQRNGRSVIDLGHIPAGERYVLRLQFQVNPTSVGDRTQNVRLEDDGQSIAFLRRSAIVYP
jgi:hypothetical protein